MFNARELALKKAEQAEGSVGQWFQVFERARLSLRVAGADLGELLPVAEACRSPQQFAFLFRLWCQWERSHVGEDSIIRRLVGLSERSQFGLPEWLSALERVGQWLDEQGRSAELGSMLDYVLCCTELPDAQRSGEDFAGLVATALEVYGMDPPQRRFS